MSIRLGMTDPSALRLGTTAVSKLMLGATEIWSAVDADAQAYFDAIVAAGSSISDTNKAAVNAFVVGCKADGIWAAIKAACLLCAADSLTGALVPLVGTAPTNVGFVPGDYSRTTGLIGGGGSKYLDANRNNNADPQNNQHVAYFPTVLQTNSGIPVGMVSVGVASGISTIGGAATRSRNATGVTLPATKAANRLCGISRASSSEYSRISNGTLAATNQTSDSPANSNFAIFGWPAQGSFYSNERISFYSIGEALNLSLLDARLVTLMSALT